MSSPEKGSLVTGSNRIREEHILEAGRKAAQSLAAWIGHPVRLDWTRPETVPAEDIGDIFGPADAEVAACVLEVSGSARGRFVLIVDAPGIARFVNAMMGQGPELSPRTRQVIAEDPAAFWDELARSAALETANIVACAFLNALAISWQESSGAFGVRLVPSPPRFTLDFAGSLSQMLVGDIAAGSQGVILTKSRMHVEDVAEGDWRLVWVPLESQPSAADTPAAAEEPASDGPAAVARPSNGLTGAD